MELKCIECGAPIERPGKTGPIPRFCAEHRRLRRNAERRAYYAANREAQIEAVREWQRANPERKKATAAAWYAADPARHNGRRRDWAQANPKRDPAAHRLRKYGLSQEQYDALLAGQGGTCAVDGCDATTGWRGTQLYVDHDHACCAGDTTCGSCVRGLLCGHHNAGIGLLGDDPTNLRAAADYLERPRLRVV